VERVPHFVKIFCVSILLKEHYLNIPYQYQGGAVESGLDCWGLVAHIYRHDLGIDLDFCNYYQHCPSHDRLSLRQIIKLQKNSEFVQTDVLVPYTVILGIGLKSFGFGVWTGDRVICSSVYVGSHTKTWEQWKFGVNRSLLFDWRSNVLRCPETLPDSQVKIPSALDLAT
jgi:NlpC/P60 family